MTNKYEKSKIIKIINNLYNIVSRRFIYSTQI